MHLQRYEEAVAAIEQAIHLDPDQAQFYFWKCGALRALKRDTEALAAYDQAVRLDPRYAPGIFPQPANMFEREAGE
jgi:tetratricopeptide (TPR) repeat protein